MYSMFFKEEFLDTVDNDKTKKLYLSLFSKTEKLEEKLDKDLYNFQSIEIEQLLYTFNTPYLTTLRTYINQCKNYVDYAIEKGRTSSNINLFDLISTRQLEEFLVKHKLKFYSKDDIYSYIDNIYNPIDYALTLAVFEGVGGTKFSEFVNMKKEHIREAEDHYNEGTQTYTLVLYDTDNMGKIEKRDLQISKDLLRALQNGLKQDVYYSKNGNSESKAATVNIIDGEEVFRNTVSGRSTESKIQNQYVYRRFRNLKDWTDDYITSVTTIKNSGIIYYLSQVAKNSEVSYDEAAMISERFTIKKQSYTNVKYKNFLKLYEKPLKDIYNIDTRY